MSDFDLVNIIPNGVSYVNSRKDVDLSPYCKLLPFMKYPIFSSPMETLSGVELVQAMDQAGCLGILHRMGSYEKRIENIYELYKTTEHFGIAVGINDSENELNIVKKAVEVNASLICIDIANGYLSQLYDTIKKVKDLAGNIPIMCGNVMTAKGAEFVGDAGVDFIRVGIGTGSVCTTKQKTGVSRGMLASILDIITNDQSANDNYLVADGGIRSSGDAMKCFVAGADFIMLGGILSHANEAENKDNKYSGGASLETHLNNNKEILSVEGITTHVNWKAPLKSIIEEFTGGMRSSCTYLNSGKIYDVAYRAKLERADIVLERI